MMKKTLSHLASIACPLIIVLWISISELHALTSPVGYRDLSVGGGSCSPFTAARCRGDRCRRVMNMLSSGDNSDLSGLLASSSYRDAYQLLRRNPLLPVGKEEAAALLNNMDSLDPAAAAAADGSDREKGIKQSIDCSVFLYRRLKRQNLLRGYDCIDKDYPRKMGEVSPAKLEEITGLSVSALSPKQRTTYWRLAGLALCAVEVVFGSQLGVDPLLTFVPLTIAAVMADQIGFNGAYSESIYAAIYPDYRQKVICHEAGHLLLAYLLGIPVRGCVTNAWDARKYPEINGQAGTIFFDVKMAEELAKQKVTRATLDRLSVVTMAGIAAEALKFGNSEGGIADERSLIGLFSSIQPPWNMLRIQGQARWAVVQAIGLIQEHQAAYDAVVAALEQGLGIGDVVFAIEENLPATLPSLQRAALRMERSKEMESDALLRFVQKMTYDVGGILPDDDSIDPAHSYVQQLSSQAVNSTAGEGVAMVGSSAAPAEMMTTMMGSSRNESTDSTSSTTVEVFAERMRLLEKALGSGDLQLDADKAGKGLWLNGLQSYKPTRPADIDPLASASAVSTEEEEEDSSRRANSFEMPKPLPGYESALEDLARSQGLLPGAAGIQDVDAVSSSSSCDESTKKKQEEEGRVLTVTEMLQEHRGYQMKRLERLQYAQKQKMEQLTARLQELTTSDRYAK